MEASSGPYFRNLGWKRRVKPSNRPASQDNFLELKGLSWSDPIRQYHVLRVRVRFERAATVRWKVVFRDFLGGRLGGLVNPAGTAAPSKARASRRAFVRDAS